MSEQQELVIFRNAISLDAYTKTMGFLSDFSHVAQAFEEGMKGLAASLANIDAADIPANLTDGFFTDEMVRMSDEILVQIKLMEEAEIAEKGLDYAMSEVDFSAVAALAAQLKEMLPAVTPLDQRLSDKDYLAYASVAKSDSAPAKVFEQFLGLFTEVFNKMQADMQANAQQEG